MACPGRLAATTSSLCHGLCRAVVGPRYSGRFRRAVIASRYYGRSRQAETLHPGRSGFALIPS